MDLLAHYLWQGWSTMWLSNKLNVLLQFAIYTGICGSKKGKVHRGFVLIWYKKKLGIPRAIYRANHLASLSILLNKNNTPGCNIMYRLFVSDWINLHMIEQTIKYSFHPKKESPKVFLGSNFLKFDEIYRKTLIENISNICISNYKLMYLFCT